MLFCFFKQKTAYELRISDWSSDVCSSDLQEVDVKRTRQQFVAVALPARDTVNIVECPHDFLRRQHGVRSGHHVEEIVSVEADEIGRASCRERVCQYV